MKDCKSGHIYVDTGLNLKALYIWLWLPNQSFLYNTAIEINQYLYKVPKVYFTQMFNVSLKKYKLN